MKSKGLVLCQREDDGKRNMPRNLEMPQGPYVVALGRPSRRAVGALSLPQALQELTREGVGYRTRVDEASGHDGPLSDAEFDRFKDLLRRYCAHELDQWENLQIETPYGPFYVTMTRRLPPDWPAEAFRSF